ncbi:MAG TPA: AAA family ATPase [Acidimicrobiia bacterium]|jgi:class 3 adenylate cyclase/DNA-binding CsgD family transcriptional regulator|nr:AAA family ATPase [Acidimicrobiia bacterium]
MTAVVTLLFTDLVGSTELLDRLGDDAGEQVRRTHFRLLREAVVGAGGEEVKNLGDGLMVAFESAVAGVECAVAIQRAVERHNRGRSAQPLAVRVGLHVGEPIRDEDDYFGTPVVVAKRLCDAAVGGQILASDLVRGLVGTRGGFAFSALGPVELKGLAEPLLAHEVRWAPEPARGRAGPPAAPADPRALRLVGREDELEVLEIELARAASGRLRVVLLVGEPGIGKTRLARELVARQADGVVSLSARAYPLGATASLGLWVEALERHLRALEPDEVAALCGADAVDLASLLPSVAAATGSPASEPPRIRLLGALANLLARLAAGAPLVVVLDDVHLADGSSWEALNYLARNLADHPVLLVLAARPVELSAQTMASEMLLGLEQEGHLVRRHLAALTHAELRELAEAFPGVEQAGDALLGWLMERSRGSPLFAVGLLRALLEEGADLSRPELRVLPEDLSERVGVRLRQLDAASRAVLEMVAVVGYRVAFGELMSLCGQPFDRLAQILDALVAERFVAEEEHGRDLTYEVAHPLYAEAVYRSVGGARRRALHRHVAQTLVSAGRPGPAATHFVASSDVGDPEAVAALCDALAQAEARQLHRETLALLDALLTLLPAGDRRWLDVFGALATQPEWIVDHRADVGAETAIAALRRIDPLLGPSDDPVRRGALKFNLASLLAWGTGEWEAAVPLCEEARRLCAEAGETRQELLARNEHGYIAGFIGGDQPVHETVALDVVGRAESAGDSVTLLQGLCSLAHALWMKGDITGSLDVTARAMAVARQDGKLYRVSYLLAQEGWALGLLGHMDAAHARIAAGKEANPSFRDTLLLDWAAQVHWLAGELPAAGAAFREQRAWDGAPSRRRAFGAGPAAICAAEAGDAATATAILGPATAVFGGREWAILSDVSRWASGTAAWLRGDAAEAAPTLARCVARQEACGWGGGLFGRGALADLAEVAASTGDPASAQVVLGYLDAPRPGLDGEPLVALDRLARGAAALVLGPADEAVASLLRAAETFARAGWPLFHGRALALLGRARAAGGDRDAALEDLRRAAEVFDACGAVVRRGWVAEDMRRLGARGRRAAGTAVAGPAALTKREREVARLAVEGRSAKEIAAALFIGERTVESHLASAYAKLGVSSRVDLVRLAGCLEL